MATPTPELQRLDKAHVWHPFTQMEEWAPDETLVIERAEGCHLIDSDGRRYLDGISSLWVTVHGHGHPALTAAIKAQLDRVAHSTLLGAANVPAIELAARLAALAPAGLGRVFYSDSGSTAVEIALKMAFQYWQLTGQPKKSRFLRLEEAYHGDTLGAVAVGGISLFHEIFGPIVIDTIGVQTPHPYRHPAGPRPEAVRDVALDQLEAVLRSRGSEIAAFILEPLVQGAAGILVHPPGYLRRAAELCRAHDVLLILDEVATGFGRTGRMFACEHEGVAPDLLCLAKGLTGGYLPLAATLATDRIYQAFLGQRVERRTFFHGHTYTGNPLACAAALASLDQFEQQPVLAVANQRATRLASLLESRIAPSRWVGDVRQRGLMIGIELVADRHGAQPFPFARAIGAAVCRAARRHSVLLRPLGDVVVLMPPLSISEPECELLVDAVVRSIDEILG